MRRALACLLAAVVLCSGQGCPTPSSLSSLGRPKSTIAAGVYTGEVTYTGTGSVGGAVPLEFEPYSSTYSCEFDSEGYPLLSEDTSIAVGVTIVTTVDTDKDTDMTVTAIRNAGIGGIAIDYDVVMTYQDQSQTLEGTGTASESYKPVVGGRVDYTFTMTIDFQIEGVPVHMVQTGTGRLSK